MAGPTHRGRTEPRRPGGTRGGAPARAPRAGRAPDLARLVAAADDLERALDTIAAAPGAREAVLAELARRRPGLGAPSPWSTALLVRLAGRIGGRPGLEALVPFLADANALVQVEAAEAIDETSLAELREVLGRLVRAQPDGAFWEAVIGLLEAREERGICRLALDLVERLTAPSALAAAIEALPYLAGPGDADAVRRTLERFAADTRAVPGAETAEGPVTLGLVAAQARDTLDEDRKTAAEDDGEG
ncbi:MAG: hypothetical protein HY905_08610 [Deltaproteobacteria bacterium]|nr:hypothetical protein [Deltaproteobacteria bacterium]